MRERADEGGGAAVQQHPPAAVRAGGPPGAQAELPVRAQAGVPAGPQAAVPDQAQGAVPAGLLIILRLFPSECVGDESYSHCVTFRRGLEKMANFLQKIVRL